ncbi:MAG TPA: hypothetical protein VJ783_25100 [Pirellulales bacterium]|nr:hypothetical protein [Pirellulales bacterium]
MQESSSLEDRIEALEREVTALKQRLGGAPKQDNWIERITGTFEGDAEFAEIVKLGAEIRRKERPSGDDR